MNKLERMTCVLNYLKNAYDQKLNLGDNAELETLRDLIWTVNDEVSTLQLRKDRYEQKRDYKWKVFFKAIARYSDEWHTAYDLYGLVKDELDGIINFGSFYSRLGSMSCIATKKEDKEERVYRFDHEAYKTWFERWYGEI